MLRKVGDEIRAWFEVKKVHRLECGENTLDHPVNIRLLYFPGADPVSESDGREASGHLKILARPGNLYTIEDRPPVRHDQPLESELIAKQTLDHRFALPGPFAVNKIVGSHGRQHAGVDPCLEGGHVDFVERTLIEDGVTLAAEVVGVVGNEMFNGRNHAGVLSTLDVLLDHAGSQKRILAEVLEISPALGLTIDIEAGSEQDTHARRERFLGHTPGIHFGKLRVPGRGEL